MIATKLKVELKGVDEKVIEKVGEEGYFTRDKAQQKKGEEQFFSQGEKPEVSDPNLYSGLEDLGTPELTSHAVSEEEGHIGKGQ